MKYKIIKSFFAASFCICLLYGSIRSAYNTIVQETNLTQSTNKQNHSSSSSKKNDWSQDKSSRTHSDSGNRNFFNPSQTNSNIQNESQITQSTTNDSTQDLEDYLSNLHCGSCGRNCLLSNPHCHTGSRKASAAAEEYNATHIEA